jgi:hypothetical protein
MNIIKDMLMNKFNYFEDIVKDIKNIDNKFLFNDEEKLCCVCGRKCYGLEKWFKLLNYKSSKHEDEKKIFTELIKNDKYRSIIAVELRKHILCKGCFDNFLNINEMFKADDNEKINKKIC